MAWHEATVEVQSPEGMLVRSTLRRHDPATDRLVVLFPGMGYTCDAPLLYYIRYMALQHGFDVLALQYGFQLTGARLSWETVEAEVRSAVSQVMAAGGYREVCLVGKSIGAALAVGAAAELTEIRTSLILLTPGLSALGPARAPTLAVIGTADPVYETPDCQGALQRGDMEWLVLEGLNHGLASRDDWARSLEALSRVLPACERFLLSWLEAGLRAPEPILEVWRRFASIPCETFTKGWWHRRFGGAPRQRTVAEMREHRRRYGTGGNCFDLALWLRHELQEAGISARLIGHDLVTDEAHIAVLATDAAGNEYLCDPGDLWLQPIRVSTSTAVWLRGFVPGRSIQVERAETCIEVRYRRDSGKVGSQRYELAPVSEELAAMVCLHSQNRLRSLFVEALLPHPDTGAVEHWEWHRQGSFWNLGDGPVYEEPCTSEQGWVERIHQRSGIAPEIIRVALGAYS